MTPARMLALLRWQSAYGTAPDLSVLERGLGQPLEDLLQQDVSGPALLEAARSPSALEWAHETQRRCEASGITVTAGEDVPLLARLPIPPLLVYGRGVLPEGPALGVVGARSASAYGLRMTERLCTEVAGAGVTIVSGLARGIDAAAHRAALAAGGRTVAVLGCGPDIAYPLEHAALMDDIARNGCLLSEWPPGVPPLPHHFPQRNRLLVALCQALLVVEARLRSGTFTSVRWAADLGCDVLVVPGPVDAPLAEGPLQLLREGATPVGTSMHILEALGLLTIAGTPVARSNIGMSAQEGRVLALLGAESLDLDEIVRALAEPPGSIMATLMGLELRGVLERDNAFAWRVVSSPQRAVADGKAQCPVQRECDTDEHNQSGEEVAQSAPQSLAQVVPPGNSGAEIHHQEERHEQEECHEEAHGF